MRKGTKLDPALKQKRFMKKKILAERLTQLLKEKNLSQTELALKANMTDQMISDYCVGRAIPRSSSLLTIASILDVHESWLIGEIDEKKPYPMDTKSKEFFNENRHFNIDINQIAQILVINNGAGTELARDYQEIIERILKLNTEGINKLISYADDLIKLKEYRYIKSTLLD